MVPLAILVMASIALAAENNTALPKGGNAGRNDICNGVPITLSVEVEYLQQSLTSTYKRSIITTSTASFRSDYQKIAGSLEVSGTASADVLFAEAEVSTSAKGAFDHVTDQVRQYKKDKHVDQQEKITYNADLTQVLRKKTTSITINGHTASTEETEWMNTAPKNNPRTQEQLDQDAKDYLMENYGDMNKGGQATGTKYTQKTCLITSKYIS